MNRWRAWAPPLLPLVLLAGAGAVSALNRTVDPDLFWHLRAAQDIVREGRVVLPDSWNYLFAGHPWVNQQWLSQLAILAAWSWGGFLGLALLKGALVAGVVAALWGVLGPRGDEAKVLSAGLFLAASEQFFMVRTHLFSLLALALLLLLLRRLGDRGRLVALPLLFGLWSNLHAFFGVGLAVLGLYLGAEWVASRRAQGEDGPGVVRPAQFLARLALLPACAAATLLNPFGTLVWQTAFSVASSAETRLVSEWQPLWNYSFWANLPLFLVAAPFVASLLWAPREVHWPTALGALLLLGLSVVAVRFTPPFALVALAASCPALEARVRRLGRGASGGLVAAGALGGLAAMALAAHLALVRPQCIPGSLPAEPQALEYPVAAVRWMQNEKRAGRVFNSHNWGGYIVWAHPGCQTFLDPRTGVLLYPPRAFLRLGRGGGHGATLGGAPREGWAGVRPPQGRGAAARAARGGPGVGTPLPGPDRRALRAPRCRATLMRGDARRRPL